MKKVLAFVFVAVSALALYSPSSSPAPSADETTPVAWGTCPTGQSLCLNGCQPPPKCLLPQ